MREQTFSSRHYQQMADLGIDPEEVLRHLSYLRNPPPFPRIIRPCRLGDGIDLIEREPELLALHGEAARAGRLSKFVPASGAATRMFRALSLWLHEEDERRSAPMDKIKAVVKEPLEDMGKSDIDPETLLLNIRDRSGIFMGYGEAEYGFTHLKS